MGLGGKDHRFLISFRRTNQGKTFLSMKTVVCTSRFFPLKKLVSNCFFKTIPVLPFAGIDSGPRNRKDPIFFLKRNHLSVRSDLSKLTLKTKLEEKGKKKIH